MLVGAEGTPSSGCFLPLSSSEPTPVVGDLRATVLRERSFESSLKLEVEAALIQAGVAAQAASALMQRRGRRRHLLQRRRPGPGFSD